MGSIRSRSGKLFIDFRYMEKRCRERTTLEDTTTNRKRLNSVLKRLEAEITLGTFVYAKYFPKSPSLEEFTMHESANRAMRGDTPLFSDFTELCFLEKRVEWRKTVSRQR